MIDRIHDIDVFVDTMVRLNVGHFYGFERLSGADPLPGWFLDEDGLWHEGDEVFRQRIKAILGDT